MTSRHVKDDPILICYNGSAGARRAVAAAGALFPGRSAIVLHVWPGIDPRQVATTAVEAERRELIKEVHVAAGRDAARLADEGANMALVAGLDARPLTVEAKRAAGAILRVAAEESAAAVVVGHRRRSWLGALLPGSVSRSVMDNCPLPVVVVGW